jgi:hypothetical protein
VQLSDALTGTTSCGQYALTGAHDDDSVADHAGPAPHTTELTPSADGAKPGAHVHPHVDRSADPLVHVILPVAVTSGPSVAQ